MKNHPDNPKNHHSRQSRIRGCLLGGAVGDALGAPIEFMDIHEIRRRYGSAGVTRFETAYGRSGAITDDTQMTLFTAEGLILTTVRSDYQTAPITAVYHAYLRWLYTQDMDHQTRLVNTHGTCAVLDGILTGHQGLFSRRAPGNTCLGALRSGQMGTIDQPINDSKGCGGVMRVAPIGLAYDDVEKAFRLGCEAAAITHGHPTGVLSAGVLAALVSGLISEQSLVTALDDASRILVQHANHDETLQAIEGAMDLWQQKSPSPKNIERLGAGWVAEEALSIGLYCALVAGDDFEKGVLLAVNHSGDSDSTGSIAGNIIGIQCGAEGIPAGWLAVLEMKDLIEEIANDLVDRFV
jgi:ADP-ribosyl-[dinitrogen reductase] hydrolase